MAFVRSKNIKGRKYYYLVESRRVNGQVQQKVLEYLGVNPNYDRLRGKLPPGDWDKDGVPNSKDCRPLDSKKQHVVARDGKFVVTNKSKTKTLGTHATRKAALAQLGAIEASKSRTKENIVVKEGVAYAGVKEIGGIKDVPYKKIKGFKNIKADGDFDKDGVKNSKDCRPLDFKQQDLKPRPYVVSTEGEVFEGKPGQDHHDIMDDAGIKVTSWDDVGKEMRARVYPDEKEIKLNSPANAEAVYTDNERQFQLEMLKDKLKPEAEGKYVIKDWYGKKIGELKPED